jgi:ATP-dependent DNA helicase RecG
MFNSENKEKDRDRVQDFSEVDLSDNLLKAKSLLSMDIRYVKGVGPIAAQNLYKKGIFTVEDALFTLPKSYENRANIKKISEIQEGEKAVIIGQIVRKENLTLPTGKNIKKIIIYDGSGYLECVWFSNSNYTEIFNEGDEVAVFGEVKSFRGTLQIYHPKIVKKEKLSQLKVGKIISLYVISDHYESSQIARVVRSVLENCKDYIVSLVPKSKEKEYNLLPLKEALLKVHIPEKYAKSIEEIEQAKKRIIFEEIFRTQVSLFMRRKKVKHRSAPQMIVSDSLMNFFYSNLPFRPTNAQVRAIEEIRKDMEGIHPMYRLLQGDVGSGKTLVAFAAALISAVNGYQTAVMSPTEILSKQLYENFKRFGTPFDLNVQLVTGSTKKSERKEISEGLKRGKINILVGTHALIYDEDLKFEKLGLVIIDEQHRFGVLQRIELINKAEKNSPHILAMTATPIPRTVSLTVWGDLDISIIDEFPPGKKPVKTKVIRESERFFLFKEIEKELRENGKVYVVYPLLKDSEKLDLPSAEGMYKTLSERFSNWGVGLIHGKMSGEKKTEIIKDFTEGKINLLVSTTVIEVGIDVPDATLIVIERAERFGLSQIHQLRGRVGRREKEGKCILVIPDNLSENSENRIRILEKESDGFKIAEYDLEIRGPGDILGTRQHGFSDLKVEALKDTKLISLAREIARKVVFGDLRPEEERIFTKTFEIFLQDKADLVMSG